MRTMWKPACIVGGIQAAWWLTVVLVGQYTNMWLGFWLVLALQFAGMAWILRRTALEGNGFVRQLMLGSLAFVIVGLFVFVSTWIGWAWLAPDYADTFVELARRRFEVSGNLPPDLDQRLAELHGMYTPIRQSFFGFVATVATGVVFSLMLAPFLRARASGNPR